MANQLPPGQRTTVQGALDGCPCPWCGGKNDLRDMQQQQLLDTGHRFFCDHCKRSMEVTSIRNVTVVAVRKNNDGSTIGPNGAVVRRPQPQQQQRPTQGGGFMAGVKKLLGGPK